MTTTFADISHHQTSVDLAAYKAAGHDRIVMKATEGTGFVDPAFADRWREAGRLGLARVAYHYSRAKFDGAVEFEHFWSVVQAAGGIGQRDRLCLDVEDTNTPARAVANCREFGARAIASDITGVTRGMVYTGNWYVKQVAQAGGGALAADVFPPGWRHLWISHYDGSVPDDEILIPAGWSRDQVVARQFTDRATVPGVSGGCDYSRLFRDWLPPATPPATPVTPTITSTGDDMRIIAREGDYLTVLLLGDGTRRPLHDNKLINAYRVAGVSYKLLPPEQFAAIIDATPPSA